MAKQEGGESVRLSNISTTKLQREIERRESKGRELMRTRDALLAQVARIEAQLRDFKPSSGARRGRAPGGAPRSGSLAASLHAVLKGKQMGVTEVAEAVQKAGYKTDSENFRTIVNACLIKHTNLFRKVSRGLYTAA